MRKGYGKFPVWILVTVLAAGLLGGCRTGTGKDTGTTGRMEESLPDGQEGSGQSEAGQEGRGQGSQGGRPQGPVAMGRYKETELPVPEEVRNQRLVRFLRGASGELELYTIEGDFSEEAAEPFWYVYREGSWQKQADWPGSRVLKEREMDLAWVTLGQDHQFYLGGTDRDYRYHLLRLEPDGGAAELLEQVFQPRDGRQYGLVPAKFEVLENGNILVYNNDQAELYTPAGSRLFSMARDFSGDTGDGRGFCDGKEFVTVWEDRIVRYDLESGQMTGSVDFEEVKGGRAGIQLFGDGSGGIYLAGEAGLSHISQGGTLWEILIDGSLTRLGMRSLHLRGFLAGDQGEYYGAFSGEGGRETGIFRYEYDPDLATVPPGILTVYSLKDQSTVRQAASQFQSSHPDVRVEVRTAVESGGTVTEEMIQSLNTELLSGRGADILILDGLPAASYVEKGILLDISGLVEELEDSGAMLDNLLEGFRQEDGKVFQVPARVGFPVLLGKDQAIQAYTSLDTLAAYQGERPLMAAGNYENLLRKVAYLSWEELFGNGSIFKKEGLVKYLETVKTLGEANGSRTMFSSQEEMERLWTNNHVLKEGMAGSAIQFDNRMCDSGLELLDGFSDLAIPAQVRVQNPGSLLVPAGNVYLPRAMAGINRSTAHEDLARDFIRCLLSVEVQKEELYDGFPVNREALLSMAEDDHEGYSLGAGVGDYSISATWPSGEVRKELVSMMEKLTRPAVVDETVMKMIVEGSAVYLEGGQTADEAAEGIRRKLSIYQAE